MMVLVLAFHFSMTALYNTPFNPIKEKYGEEINSYMSPHFSQDWHLFAPNPVDTDSGVLIRAKKKGPGGSVLVTKWSDVTSPNLKKLYAERLWPSRATRVPSGVVHQLESWQDPELEKLRSKKEDSANGTGSKAQERKGSEPPLSQAEEKARDEAIRFTQGFAGTEAEKRWGKDIEYVQVRIVRNEYPRFSQRYSRETKGKVSYYDLAWMKPGKVKR
ncbi:DUF5819 family protein [Streptomyces sp. C36]|uniref:DUF5819 family protein n=1 Tax=Streptomyces sp. C36 TaxID=3237122 RepID=UPI0034C6ABE8